jgi:hypothetical protein
MSLNTGDSALIPAIVHLHAAASSWYELWRVLEVPDEVKAFHSHALMALRDLELGHASLARGAQKQALQFYSLSERSWKVAFSLLKRSMENNPSIFEDVDFDEHVLAFVDSN